MAKTNCRTSASTLWAQRNDKLLLTVTIADCKDPSIEFTSDSLHFRGHGDVGQDEYDVTMQFFKELNPEKCKYAVLPRHIKFSLAKKESGPYWPRLLKENKKNHWLKTDFELWVDEDDSDAEAGGDDQNFEQMMQKMGNFNPGAAGDLGGEEDEEEDSDDEELPDLESS